MEENEVRVAVYLVTGFLESGKTTFLDYTIRQDYFKIEEDTLLIACEEGEVEYDPEVLKENHTSLVQIESKEDFTLEKLQELEDTYHPERVLLEFNPLWSVKELEEMTMPEGWALVQEIVTVDASTFQVYMANMKSLFVEMVTNADMTIFNRCNKELPLNNFRRSVKVVNPAGEILFETEAGEMTDVFDEELPYDIDAEVIEIEDIDYGIFFIDVGEHPEKYRGKTVSFTAKAWQRPDLGDNAFIPGRMAMTCCADDVRMIGYMCFSKNASMVPNGGWIKLTATVDWGYVPDYGGEGPILRAKSIKSAQQPVSELVYFN